MSDEPRQETADSEIRFDRAEPVGVSSLTRCAVCGESLMGSYFEINGAMVCEPCREKVAAVAQRGSKPTRLLRSLGAGLGAAVVGAGIYYAVLAVTGYEVGLIAIVVGFLVGGAVRWGSYARGGWLYQTLAVGLTYVAIVSTYVPFVIKGMQEHDAEEAKTASSASAAATSEAAGATGSAAKSDASTPPAKPNAEAATAPSFGGFVIALATMAGFILALPFLAGFQNFLGWLIISFALFQAWKMNRRQQLVVNGPFRLASGGVPPPPLETPPPALEPA